MSVDTMKFNIKHHNLANETISSNVTFSTKRKEDLPWDVINILAHDLKHGPCTNHHQEEKCKGNSSVSTMEDGEDVVVALNTESSIDTHSSDDSGSSTSFDNNKQNIKKHTTKPFFTEKWELRYQELLEFGMKHQHVNVPHTFPENKQLARWVKRQRIQYKRFKDGMLPSINQDFNQDRIDRLNAVGFVWDSHELTWRENFYALQEFREKFGHCNVPMANSKDSDKHKHLGIWVKTQRRQFKLYQEGKRSSIDGNRIKELNEMGFEWKLRVRRSKIEILRQQQQQQQEKQQRQQQLNSKE